jgi:hypothetical protein
VLLVNVAAGLATIAGCGEVADDTDNNSDYETLTPVAVPRKRRNEIAELKTLLIPTVPIDDLVDKGHVSTAVDHFEDLIAETEEALGAVNRNDVTTETPPPGSEIQAADVLNDSDRVLREARERATSFRTMEPSAEVLSQIHGRIRAVAERAGYAGAVAGTLDGAQLETDLERLTQRIDSYRRTIEYRLATPVENSIVTFERVERTLPASELSEEPSGDEMTDSEKLGKNSRSRPGTAALLRGQLAAYRRSYEDAIRFQTAVTDT